MARSVKTDSVPKESTRKVRPARTPEGQETQMIALATNLARQQLLDGTASSQVITHFLKLGTEKEKLEKEKLREENRLLKAKTEAMESSARIEELYEEAMLAFKTYHGDDDEY